MLLWTRGHMTFGWAKPTWTLSLTLLLKLFKEIQAGNAGASEDYVVFPCRVLTKALGHQAVELSFVLQSIQTFSPTAFLQVDINLNKKAEPCKIKAVGRNVNV